MRTRPTPSGFQHALELRPRRAPADQHTDQLTALDDTAAGLTPSSGCPQM